MLDNFGGYVAAEPEVVYGYVETYFDFIADIYYIPRTVIFIYILLLLIWLFLLFVSAFYLFCLVIFIIFSSLLHFYFFN